MVNFLHANDNDLHMYAKFGGLSFQVCLYYILQDLIYRNFL
jgi:hypothetical protein